MMLLDRDKPDFETDGAHWPHRAHSRFVSASGLTFHVQQLGEGPDLVLIHGTGASTHSFRAMMSLLATDYRVTAFDLPGHGFTETPVFTRLTLPEMSRSSADLLSSLGIEPVALVGHSAGVPVALRMTLDGRVAPQAIVGFNASIRPYAGAAAPLFSAMARVLFVNPMTPRVFAATATPRRVEHLLANTGSRIDAEGVGLYQTLFRRAGHVAGALGLMAGWELKPLNVDLPGLTVPLTLVAGTRDRTVPPANAASSAGEVQHGNVVRMMGLGHLAHEEDPVAAAAIVREALA